MQRQEKEWWESEQIWPLQDEIGWYNISISKKSFKEGKMFNIILLYRHLFEGTVSKN
jgi:hypothetical protein